MWLINLLPDWIYHLIVLIGICGVVASITLSYFPSFISKFQVPIKLLSVIVLSVGVFFEGTQFATSSMEDDVTELKHALAIAEEKSKNVNERVVVEYKTKIIKVKEKSDEIVRYIDRYINESVDREFPIPNAFVVLHDSAAKNELPPSPSGAYEGTSDVKISEVGKTVVENYETCHELRLQVKAWQQWYTEQKNIFDTAAK